MNQGEEGISTNILIGEIGEQRGLLIIAIPLVVVIAGTLVLSLIHPVKAQKDNSLVSLSLEPKEIRVPYRENEITDLVLVELRISNVSNLKEFHLNLRYDQRKLEFLRNMKMGEDFYTLSGGWHGNMFNGELAGTFSGSGTMFIYTFKLLETGSTTIKLTETELIDENGNTIPHTTSGTTVEVVSFDNWVNGKYAELKESYENLQDELNEVRAEKNRQIQGLERQISTLESRIENLENELGQKDRVIENLGNELSQKDTVIESLYSRSRMWQLATAVAGIVAIVIAVLFVRRR